MSANAAAEPARDEGPLPASSRAHAQASDAEISRRLAFIETRLDRGARSAGLWWDLWYYGFVVLTVGQAAPALAVKDQGLRSDLAIGAVFASLGVVPLGVVDFPPRYAAAALRRLPRGTPDERRRKLARGERLLAASAAAETLGRSWLPHVTGTAVAIAGCLVHALAYKRIASCVTTLIGGVAINEAHIFTQPTAAIDDWRAYREGAFGDAHGSLGAEPSRLAPASGRARVWSMAGQPAGVGVGGAF